MSEEHDSHDTGPPAYPFWVRAEEERLAKSPVWSLTKLSEVSTVARNTYNRLKKQKGKAEPETISKLAEALGIPKQEAMQLAGLSPVVAPVGEAAQEAEEAEVARLEKLLEHVPHRRRQHLERVREEEQQRFQRNLKQAREDFRRSISRIEEDARWEIERNRNSPDNDDAEEENPDSVERLVHLRR